MRSHATDSAGRRKSRPVPGPTDMFDMAWEMSNIWHDMSDMTRNVLGPTLEALAEQLEARGVELHLVIVDGSGLLAMGLSDRPTQDVDVVALLRHGELVSAQPFPPAL